MLLIVTLMILCTSSSLATHRFKFTDDLEVKESEGCSDVPIDLACFSDQDIVILDALVYGRVFAKDCKVASYNRQHSRESVAHFVNNKCNGEWRCSFNLKEDVPAAASNFSFWEGNVVVAHYTCVNKSDWIQYCGSVSTASKGWLRSTGYPKFYLGPEPCTTSIKVDPLQHIGLVFPDLDIKDSQDNGCRDNLTLSDASGSIFSRCGASKKPSYHETSHHQLNVTLYASGDMVYSRGYIAYYYAIGCPTPPSPENGSLTLLTPSTALVRCDDGFGYFDPLSHSNLMHYRDVKQRHFRCKDDIWEYIPQCTDFSELLRDGNITQYQYEYFYNSTMYEHHKYANKIGTWISIGVPLALMIILVLVNCVIVAVILWRRRRLASKGTDDGEWDSIKSNAEEADDVDTGEPSQV